MGRYALETSRAGLRRFEAEARGPIARCAGSPRAGDARQNRLQRTVDAAIDAAFRQLPARRNLRSGGGAAPLSRPRVWRTHTGQESLFDGAGRVYAGRGRRTVRRRHRGVGDPAPQSHVDGYPRGTIADWRQRCFLRRLKNRSPDLSVVEISTRNTDRSASRVDTEPISR